MSRPTSLWDQYRGKAYAAVMRGSGLWPPQPHPCALEPPCPDADRDAVTSWECFVNGWDGPFQRTLISRLLSRPGSVDLRLPEESWGHSHELVPVVIERFPEDEPTLAKAEQFLLSLKSLRRPLAFEVLGVGPQPKFDVEKGRQLIMTGGKISEAICGWSDPYIAVQYVAGKEDAPHVQRQLTAHYPNSAVVIKESLGSDDSEPGRSVRSDGNHVFVAVLNLEQGFCFPLKSFSRYDPDPLGVAIAAMETLGERQWALLQILFARTQQEWLTPLSRLLRDPYKGEPFFDDLSDRVLATKFNGPLFAVSIRLVTNDQGVFRHLDGWSEQFASAGQQFGHLGDEAERDELADSIEDRSTHRPGMILNLPELASLAHVPNSSVFSERLRMVKTRTRPAPKANDPFALVLGTNVHRGVSQPAVIPSAQRLKHCYISGASGTGKSTLLLNMLVQDVYAGSGLAVLDPHGDLINDLLVRIPADRLDDVVYFNATDRDFPVGLNVLHGRPEDQGRIVGETVAIIHRFFPDSWGPQLQQILTNALATAASFRGLTIQHVERLLIDEEFRRKAVAKLTNPRLASFWTQQFPDLVNATKPVLNKLAIFLDTPEVANIVCQRETTIDFEAIMSGRKIFLCNLAGLPKGVSGILGTLLVTKIINQALKRAHIPEAQRLPFYMYVDEFQNFANLATISFDTVLVEARKFKLSLTMANQFLRQVPPDVQAAVFNSAGTLITFRLGVDEAPTIARQYGGFTDQEILNLDRGQALVRPEVAGKSYNLETPPPPAPLAPHFKAEIIARCRAKYARPRKEVEAELNPLAPPPSPPSQPPPKAQKPPAQAQTMPPPPATGACCPLCGAPLVARHGSYGFFVVCSKSPSCQFKQSAGGQKPSQPASAAAGPKPQPTPQANTQTAAPPTVSQPSQNGPRVFQVHPRPNQVPQPTADITLEPPPEPKAKPKPKKTPPPMSSGEGNLDDWVT